MLTEHYAQIRKVVFAAEGPNEDLVQEIAIKLAPLIDQLEDQDNAGAWIRSATRVRVRRYRPEAVMTGALPRTRGAGRIYSSQAKNVELTDVKGWVGDGTEKADVRVAVSRLPENDRKFVLMHMWGDLTLEETGTQLGMSKWAAIRRWNNHILPALRSELEDSI